MSIRCRARLFSPGSMSSATAVDRLLRTLARTRLYCNNLQDAQKELLQESENRPLAIPPSTRLDKRFSKKFPRRISISHPPCSDDPPSSSTPPRAGSTCNSRPMPITDATFPYFLPAFNRHPVHPAQQMHLVYLRGNTFVNENITACPKNDKD